MNKVKFSLLIILNAALTGIFITLATWRMQYYVWDSISQIIVGKYNLNFVTKLMVKLFNGYHTNNTFTNIGFCFWLIIVTYSLFVWKFTCWDEKTIQKVFRATWLVLLSYFCYLAMVVCALYIPYIYLLAVLVEESLFQSFCTWVPKIWGYFIAIAFCFFLGRALWKKVRP